MSRYKILQLFVARWLAAIGAFRSSLLFRLLDLPRSALLIGRCTYKKFKTDFFASVSSKPVPYVGPVRPCASTGGCLASSR